MNKLTQNTKVQAVGKFFNKHMGKIMLCLMLTMMISSTVFAAAGADVLWTNLTTLIEKWVTRLGGVVMLIGGIMFGLGWKSDDAEQKSRGISTIIAGAIVIAVANLTTTFFQ